MTRSETACPPFDFSTFVAQRRGLAADAAAALVADWLAHYEPGPVARSKSADLGAAVQRPTKGVHVQVRAAGRDRSLDSAARAARAA